MQKVGPDTPDFGWNPRPKTPSIGGTQTRDPEPGTHLIDGTQDSRSGTLKVGPETPDPYNNNKTSIHGTRDSRLQNLRVDFEKTF